MRLATHEQHDHLLKWIKRLVMPYEELGGNRVCPYAHFASITMVCPTHKKHCERLTEQYPDMIFLPDSEKETYINGVQTNNGKYKLILCQSKEKLLDARKQLAKTDYYTFWQPEYYEEIVGDSLD